MDNAKNGRPGAATPKRPADEQTLTPGNIIQQLDCIMNMTREQVRSLPRDQRNRIYAAGLREFESMVVKTRNLLCGYEAFRRCLEDWCGI